ncbi:hypothetical protein NPIL_618781, partial [Nephila pilipes]
MQCFSAAFNQIRDRDQDQITMMQRFVTSATLALGAYAHYSSLSEK